MEICFDLHMDLEWIVAWVQNDCKKLSGVLAWIIMWMLKFS